MAGTTPDRPGAQEWVPDGPDVETLGEAAHACRGCELWASATQVVFSSGPDDADVVLVGEQPGDREDREGEPFVGPAGRVLADALGAAGLEPERWARRRRGRSWVAPSGSASYAARSSTHPATEAPRATPAPSS